MTLLFAPGSSDARGSSRQLFRTEAQVNTLRDFDQLVKYCKNCQQEIWVYQLVLNHNNGVNLQLVPRI